MCGNRSFAILASAAGLLGACLSAWALEQDTPAQGSVYYPTSPISSSGEDAEGGVIINMKDHNEVIESSGSATPDEDGDWAGTVQPPTGGWSITPSGRNHKVEATDGEQTDFVYVKIVAAP